MDDHFLERLRTCTDLPEAKALFAEAIAPFGYTASACGAFVPSESGPEPHFFFQDWPATWTALYQKRNFHQVDFGVAEARRRIAPFTWADVRGNRVMSAAEEDLWRTVTQWGWTDGFSVPIHGPGGYLGLVTMAGKRPLLRHERDRLHLMALHLHDRCQEMAGLAMVATPPAELTPRELECLRWVAAGKTDPEIGALVALSRATVKDHVDAARRKLGARTRPQAVVRLVLAGLC
jgi:LuxR family quorum sensing-dependent transcriptional regulator